MNDMRDRLVELISDMENELLRSYPYTTDEYRIACLADHLIENGVILPPCKVGDKVYWILPDLDGWHVSKDTVTEVGLKGFWVSMYTETDDMDDFTSWDEFGKTVFLTRDDAEKALRERDGE